MKTDKTKLLQDIEAMKEKLASMEKELNKPEVFKHFPSKGEVYYFYTSLGSIYSNNSSSNNLKVNAYRTEKEAQKAYNKAVAVEKVKRKLLELQGDWKPDWTNEKEEKYYIQYGYNGRSFISICWYTTQHAASIPYIKSEEVVNTILNEMEDELKLIYEID